MIGMGLVAILSASACRPPLFVLVSTRFLPNNQPSVPSRISPPPPLRPRPTSADQFNDLLAGQGNLAVKRRTAPTHSTSPTPGLMPTPRRPVKPEAVTAASSSSHSFAVCVIGQAGLAGGPDRRRRSNHWTLMTVLVSQGGRASVCLPSALCGMGRYYVFRNCWSEAQNCECRNGGIALKIAMFRFAKAWRDPQLRQA